MKEQVPSFRSSKRNKMRTKLETRLSVVLRAVGILVILSAAVQAQERVTSSYPGIAGYNIPFWVALDTGEFRKVGLDVDPVLISGGSRSMQVLLAGGLNFAHTSGGVAAQANLNGADVVIIGTISNTMSAGIIASKEIQSLRDLKGKKVGIASFGGNNDVGMRFALKHYGLDPSRDVIFFQVGGEKTRLAALQKGAIQATIISPPGLFAAETMGFKRLVDLADIGMRYPELSIVVRKKDIREKQKTLRKYLRAHLKAIRTFRTNRPATINIIQKYITVGSRADAVKTYDYFVKTVSESLKTDLGGIKDFLESIDSKVPGAARRNPADFVDSSILEEELRNR